MHSGVATAVSARQALIPASPACFSVLTANPCTHKHTQDVDGRPHTQQPSSDALRGGRAGQVRGCWGCCWNVAGVLRDSAPLSATLT